MRDIVKIALVFSVSCLALMGCKGKKNAFDSLDAPRHHDELQRVTKLMYDDPQSALDSIVKWESPSESWSVSDRYEWCLRYVEALFKTRQLTEESPDLGPVVRYYDSLSLLFPEDEEVRNLQAHAYYYKGVTLTKRKEDAEATSCFLAALRGLEGLHDDSPVHQRFVALTHTRLGEILYAYGINELARKAFAAALDGFSSVGDTMAVASMIRNDAAIYQAEKEYDKALARFNDAEQLLPLGADMLCHSQGCLLYESQLYDSAAPYLERSFAIGDHFARTDAAARLADIYRQNGNLDREVYFTRYYVGSALNETNSASTKMEIEFLCGNENNDVLEMQSDSDINWRAWILAVMGLVAVLVIFVFVIVKNRRRISIIEQQINDMAVQHTEETKGKDREIEHIAKQLIDTREQLKNQPHIDFDEAWKRYADSAIVKKINKMVEGKDLMIKSVGLYPELKLKEVDCIELLRELNKSFENFNLRFLKDYPELTRADLRYCALAVLGLNDVEMAVLNGISYSGTNRRTNKILSVMQSSDSLEMTLLTYLKNNW